MMKVVLLLWVSSWVSAMSDLTWSYSGILGPSTWWLDHFSGCRIGDQSPIDLVAPIPSSDTFSIIRLATDHPPPYNIDAVVSQKQFNFLRADLWFNLFLVNATFQGAQSSSYILHHMSLRVPSEHSFNGTLFDAEIQCVFFPHSTDKLAPISQSNGFTVSFPLKSSNNTSIVTDKRLSRSVHALTEGLQSAGVKVPLLPLLSLSNGSHFARYVGSLTFPPCSAGMNHFVKLSATIVSEKTFRKIQQIAPGSSNRPLQLLNNRQVAIVRLLLSSNVVINPLNGTLIQNRSASHFYRLNNRNVDTTVISLWSSIVTVSLLLFHIVCLLVFLVYRRITFISDHHATWVNPVTSKSVFGTEPSDDDDSEDESNDVINVEPVNVYHT